MITLFHKPNTRSARFIFLFEELGAPYELREVTTRNGDGSGAPDPANPHPHGKVPAIRDNDDGTIVYESPAIALYLTDKFPKNGVGPVVGDPKRGAYLTWLTYYGSVMEPAWTMAFLKVPTPPGMAGWAPAEDVMAHTFKTLEQGPFILGEKFSAADVLIGTTFAMFMGSPLLPKTPLVESYVQRVIGRPLYAKAMEKAGGQPR